MTRPLEMRTVPGYNDFSLDDDVQCHFQEVEFFSSHCEPDLRAMTETTCPSPYPSLYQTTTTNTLSHHCVKINVNLQCFTQELKETLCQIVLSNLVYDLRNFVE